LRTSGIAPQEQPLAFISPDDLTRASGELPTAEYAVAH
jgi:hypothetical protein